MAKYLNSENVIVFPIAKERIGLVQETRLMTEYNVSNLIRQLFGNKSNGFIISCNKDNADVWTIEFNLYGYYFKVNSISTTLFKESELTPDSDGLYAAITIDEDVDEIYGQDNKGVYEGLEFSTKIPDSIPANKHYLKLLNFDGTSFTSISNNWGFAAHAIGGIDGKYDK